MRSCYLWRYKDEILFLLKLVAKPNYFSRLWALVCSPPLKRQREHCEHAGDTAPILWIILPASVYSHCLLGDLKFSVGVPALTRMQIWTESLLPRCNREVALSLLLYRSRGELQVWALRQSFCLQILPGQAPQVHPLRGPGGPQISVSPLWPILWKKRQAEDPYSPRSWKTQTSQGEPAPGSLLSHWLFWGDLLLSLFLGPDKMLITFLLLQFPWQFPGGIALPVLEELVVCSKAWLTKFNGFNKPQSLSESLKRNKISPGLLGCLHISVAPFLTQCGVSVGPNRA